MLGCKRVPVILVFFALGACGGGGGGPVAGPADTHCDGTTPVVVEPAACDAPPASTEPEEEGDEADEYGDTLYGSEGDDDECKYHVSFTSTAVKADKDVTFAMTATYLADGSPVTGAEPRAEVFLDTTHPAPNSGSTFEESDGGEYDVGPIVFDESGRWTVRFHLFEGCVDGVTSPHGHVAFYVDVP